MAFPDQGQIDVIATKILLDAKEALLQLKGWSNSVTDAQDKTRLLKEIIKSTAQQMNGDMKSATAAVGKFANALNVNPQMVRKIGKDLQAIDKIAQQSLGNMAQKSMESSARMTLLSNAIQMMATKGKLSIDQVVSSLRTLNASTGTKFGKLGFSDTDIAKAGQIAQQTTNQLKAAGAAGKKAGEDTDSGFRRALTGVNALRIALGVLVSMLIFQVIQAVQNTFKAMIDGAREAELALYNLVNAERRLSEMGIGITPKDLQDIIDKVNELVPILSRIQTEELVSRIATNVAPALGLTREEIEKMAVATSLLYVRNKALGKSFDEVESQLTNAFLTGKVSVGINQLGVKISDQIVKDEALRMGLVKTADEFDNLSGEMEAHIKSVAMLNVVYNNAIQDQQSIGDYMETSDAQIEKLDKTWNDFLTTIGQLSAPLLVKGLQVLINALEIAIVLLEKGSARTERWVARFVGLADAMKNFHPGGETNFFEKFKEGFDRAMKSFEGLEDKTDTATGALQDMFSETNNEDLLKTLAEIEEKIQDIILDAQQAQEDLDLKLEQKENDLNTEYQRKAEDAARNHAQKLEDIDQDAIDKAEDAKRKSREDELKAEQDLLQKLKELRDRFLLDLEEALHARDARAVLRLIKEYKLDKQNILDRKKLDDQQRKDKLAEDLKAIEIERQRRIESENIEYQRKLSDLAQAKAREQEELQLWYKREQEDIARNVQQKLEKILAGYIAEGKIHESEQAKIYGILAKYFSKDMALVDNLANFMATRFAQMQNMTLSGYSAGGGLAIPVVSSGSGQKVSSGTINNKHVDSGGFAEGGTVIAKRPTVAVFGERGVEAATFTPIGRSGRDINKVFGSLGSGGGVNGQIMVAVDLSPDLEARVVQRSMDSVGNVVSKINNRKVR